MIERKVAHTFQDQLHSRLARAPWFGVSVVFHLFLVLVLFNTPWSQVIATEAKRIVATTVDQMPETLLPEPPPRASRLDEPDLDLPDPRIDEVPADKPLEPTPEDRDPIEITTRSVVIGPGGGNPRGYDGIYRRRSGRPGGVASQKGVDQGLAWLAHHQHADGNWGAESFQDECQDTVCSGRGRVSCDAGVTGLAVLAFLGAGHTPRTGRYQAVVRRALHWLERQQGLVYEGLIGRPDGRAFMYNHAIATLAMCETLAMTREPVFARPAQSALKFISEARNPHGVWRYSFPPTGRSADSDVSVTGWMLFALASGRSAGLGVDREALAEGTAYLERMTDPETWRTGYDRPGGYSSRERDDAPRWPAANGESMTAVAMLCRMLLMDDKTVEPEDVDSLRGGARLLLARLPKWEEGHVDYYYWYYGTYAMYQMSGSFWDRWQEALDAALYRTQRGDGCARGSWDPEVDPWGDVGGRVYSTALGTLSMEVYYRYDRILGAR